VVEVTERTSSGVEAMAACANVLLPAPMGRRARRCGRSAELLIMSFDVLGLLTNALKLAFDVTTRTATSLSATLELVRIDLAIHSAAGNPTSGPRLVHV